MRIQLINDSDNDSTLPNVTTSLSPIAEKASNLEAEKGEVAISPDAMSIYKILGKSHSKGGTPLNLEPNSFIYSRDRTLAIDKKIQEKFDLKYSNLKKENTPAKVLMRNIDIKHNNQMRSIMEDDKNIDIVSKNTAALMLSKNRKTLGKIAYLQEVQKGFKDGIPPVAEGSQPIYNEKVKMKIDTENQYMKKGGMTKYLDGGPTCQDGFYWDGKMCMPLSFKLPSLQNSQFKKSDFTGTYSKSPYNSSTSGDKGYTLQDREKDFTNWQEQSNLLGANLPLGYNSDNILKTQKFWVDNYPDVVENAYNTGSIGFNNKSKQNPLSSHADGYYQKDRFGVDPTIHTFPSIKERNDYMLSMGMIPTKKDPNIFYDRGKVTPNDKVTLFRTQIGPSEETLPQKTPSSTSQSAQPPLKVEDKEFKDPVYAQQKSGFSIGQQLDLSSSLGLLAGRKNYFPKMYQNSFIPVELEKLNPNQSLQENSNAWLQSGRIAASMGSNPQAASFLQKAAIEGISGANKIRESYESNNIQIANSQNQYNNQGFNNVRGQNVANRRNYDENVDRVLGRINEERINGLTDIKNKALGYYQDNLTFDNAMNSREQYAMLDEKGNPITDKNGRPIMNFAYTTDLNGNIRRNRVNGWNSVTGQSRTQDIETSFIESMYKKIGDESVSEAERNQLYKSLAFLLGKKKTSRYGGILKK
jgi:hypothetical protein